MQMNFYSSHETGHLDKNDKNVSNNLFAAKKTRIISEARPPTPEANVTGRMSVDPQRDRWPNLMSPTYRVRTRPTKAINDTCVDEHLLIIVESSAVVILRTTKGIGLKESRAGRAPHSAEPASFDRTDFPYCFLWGSGGETGEADECTGS
ncbi:hypothetical protein EVAR_35370_1 [Eumeta japonica]|uniref:Uncharacterized protein n=1 Tax=Eumeta variegata TaxID=151549 RepID=A0A4C2A569_EUMVA|nr:hypothetical protein EVAR_35370_1 [Eumeta japonica]